MSHFDKYIKEVTEHGFELIEHGNLEKTVDSTRINRWYKPLQIYSNIIIRYLSYIPLYISVHILGKLDKDAIVVQEILNDAAMSLVDGGKFDIFTPLYYIVMRVPEDVSYIEEETIKHPNQVKSTEDIINELSKNK